MTSSATVTACAGVEMSRRMARWKHGSRFRLGMSRLATCYLPFGQCSRGARRHPSPPGAARTLAAHLRSRAKIAVADDDGHEDHAPVVGAGDIAVAQQRRFHVTVLVEAEDRMVALASEVVVVPRALLLAVGLTDLTVQIENEHLERLRLMHTMNPLAGQRHQRRQTEDRRA